MPHNTKIIRHAYKENYNLNNENQVILLMITDGKKWHYLAVKSLSALFRGITGNNIGDLLVYTKKILKSIKKYVRIMAITI